MKLCALFRLAFATPTPNGLSLLHRLTRWLIIQEVRRHSLLLLRLLVSIRFQDLFHSPLGGLFTFPSRYLFTIGHWGVLRLGGWSPHVQTGFHVSRPTLEPKKHFTCTGLSPIFACFSKQFQFCFLGYWPGPRSLATTNGVSFDVLSSGYWDVSVPQVRLFPLCIQRKIPQMWWVSPFGNPRIKGYWPLPTAYRSLSRPSSPLSAKASTKCSYALDLHSAQLF